MNQSLFKATTLMQSPYFVQKGILSQEYSNTAEANSQYYLPNLEYIFFKNPLSAYTDSGSQLKHGEGGGGQCLSFHDFSD